jgi:GAF domain-containing protein
LPWRHGPGHAIERSAGALAVENERLQRALRARLSEEAALRRVATLVAQQHEPEEVFAVVTDEVARHLDADEAITVRYDAPGACRPPRRPRCTSSRGRSAHRRRPRSAWPARSSRGARR